MQGAEQGTWLAQLEAEHNNLRDALTWYADTSPEHGLRLACALVRFWEMHSHLNEGRAWLARLLPLCREAPLGLRARALNGAGVLAYLQGDYQAATTSLQESLALARASDDPDGIADLTEATGIPTGRTNSAIAAEHGHMGAADQLVSLGAMLDRGELAPGDLVALTGISIGMRWYCTLVRV